MGRVIVVLVVLVQGRGKPLAFPADSRQEVVGEGDHQVVKLVVPFQALPVGCDPKFAGGCPAHRKDRLFQQNGGIDSSGQFAGQSLNSACDGVQAHVGGIVHQVVL